MFSSPLGCLLAICFATSMSESFYHQGFRPPFFSKRFSSINYFDANSQLALLREAVKENPTFEPYLYNLGLLLTAGNDKEEAMSVLYRAAALNSSRIESWYTIAGIHESLGEVELALEAYQRAWLLLGDGPLLDLKKAVLTGIVNLSIEIGEISKAEQLCKEALENHPDVSWLWSFLGIIYRCRDVSVAKTCFENALKLSQTDHLAANNLGIIYNSLGETAKAIEAYRLAISLDPTDTSSMYNLALILLMKGDKDTQQAQFFLERTLLLDPNNEMARFLLASLQEVSGDTRLYDAAPKSYIADLFDYYASAGYEEHMLGNLKYQGPQLLWDAFSNELQTNETKPLLVAELGVGSGLLGKFFRGRGFKGAMFGCDLSTAMVERAIKTGVYQDVIVADCVDFLDAFCGDLRLPDVIVAADVLCYIGDLNKVFESAYRTVSSGGCFIFTLEKADDNCCDFKLQDTGRFAHNERYIRFVGERVGFREVMVAGSETAGSHPIVLRLQGEISVIGMVVTMRK